MNHEYLFDVTLRTSLRVRGATEPDARRKLEELLDGARANFGAVEGEPITGEVAIAAEKRALVLVEVDGEAV